MAHNSSSSSVPLSSSATNGSFTMSGQSSISGPFTGFSRTVSPSTSTVRKTSSRSISSSATSAVSSITINTVASTETSRTSSKVASTTILASKPSSSEVSASILSMSGAVSSSPPKANTAKNNSPVLPLATTIPTMPSETSHAASSPSVASTKPGSLALSTSAHAPTLPSKPPAQPGPSPTPSPASSTHPPALSTHTTVAVVKGPPSAQRTSTVTKTAGTTLSSAVAITTTNDKGANIITTPPLVTLLSTSTEAGGALTTVTNIVANPPSFGSTKSLTSDNGILHKQGVLAGICVVIGVVAATIIIGLIYFVRRSNRRRRRRRWLAGMQQQRPSSLSGDPFQDPQDSYQVGPTMRSVATSHEDVHQWDHRSDGSHRLLVRQEPLSHNQRNFFGGVSIIPDPHPTLQVVNPTEGERYEYPHARLAYTTDLTTPMTPFKRHSMTPSSPSIYPATLPADDNEHGHEADERIRIPEPPQNGQVSSVSAVPPRPPRSHLRESAKLGSYGPPLTPPDSAHSSSLPPSPVSVSELNRPQDVFVRRTILDVRHR